VDALPDAGSIPAASTILIFLFSFIDKYLRSSYNSGKISRIATQMRGRALSWERFPFSFREFLDNRGMDSEGNLSTKKRLLIQKAFEKYWATGGFPEVIGLNESLRIKTHQEYFHALLFRGLVERHDIAHPKAVSALAHWLVDNTASLYSINRRTGYLQSPGYHAPRTAVSDYLEWFEDAYFLFTVQIFDASLASEKSGDATSGP